MSASPRSFAKSPEIGSKPLKGRYDKRCLTPKQKASRQPKSQYGPKPLWMKHIQRNTAYSVLRAINDLETWPELFQWAVQCEDRRLCFDIMCYLTDRRDGKPFVATNPDENKQPATLTQDNRLQVAIGQLVVTGKKSKQKKTQPLLTSDTTIDQSYVETQPESVTPTPETPLVP